MIDINLIPANLRSDGSGNTNAVTINLPKEVLIGVASGLVLLLVTVHLIFGLIWLGGMARLGGYKIVWQSVLPDRILLDAIYKESAALRKKIGMISDMTTKKEVLWAPKFNAISDDLPKGLWIRKMVLDKTGLTMEGSVVSKNQNEIKNIGIFLAALKQNDAFIKGFSSLEVNSIQRDKNNTVEVTDFTVMAKLIETAPKINETRSK
jgi:hypothetical protein